MTTPPRRLALLIGLTAAMAAVLLLPAGALAHGDPASHYLETDQLYPGFANRPSQAVELRLLGLLEAARRADYPLPPRRLSDQGRDRREPRRPHRGRVHVRSPAGVRRECLRPVGGVEA